MEWWLHPAKASRLLMLEDGTTEEVSEEEWYESVGWGRSASTTSSMVGFSSVSYAGVPLVFSTTCPSSTVISTSTDALKAAYLPVVRGVLTTSSPLLATLGSTTPVNEPPEVVLSGELVPFDSTGEEGVW